MKNKIFALFAVMLVLFSGCQTAASHTKDLGDDSTEKFTLGNVQRKIQKGASQADVAQALGSPNIVTKDATGKESWIYDKVAREVAYSHDSGGAWLILGAYGKEAGASRQSQRTLTVVIKFDDKGSVDNVTYHSSSF